MTKEEEDEQMIRMVSVAIAAVHRGLGSLGRFDGGGIELLNEAREIEAYIIGAAE